MSSFAYVGIASTIGIASAILFGLYLRRTLGVDCDNSKHSYRPPAIVTALLCGSSLLLGSALLFAPRTPLVPAGTLLLAGSLIGWFVSSR